jgi:hypothetical protein
MTLQEAIKSPSSQRLLNGIQSARTFLDSDQRFSAFMLYSSLLLVRPLLFVLNKKKTFMNESRKKGEEDKHHTI